MKNNSDDAIANYLNSIGFKQKHTLSDTRLALGYGAFIIAVACFAWDYQFGFESTKLYTTIAVAAYTILQGILAFWISNVEDGTIYQGQAPSGELVCTTTPLIIAYNKKNRLTNLVHVNLVYRSTSPAP